MTSPEIFEIVTGVYERLIPLPEEWTPEQREGFLESEAARISYQVANLSAEMGRLAVQQWTSVYPDGPDYMTTVGLLNNARIQAMEIVLTNEFYEKMPEEPEEDDTFGPDDIILLDPTGELNEMLRPSPDRSQVPWHQRWTDPRYRTEPSVSQGDLIEYLWPELNFSDRFQMKAGYLLAAREEDGLRLPSEVDDPLTEELAQMIYADLRFDGFPER